MLMNDTDEVCQAYTDYGEPIIDLPLQKASANRGTLHGASHVWIVRTTDSKTEVLLQRRAPNKVTWPNLYDISAAGHINFGESPIQAAIRETQEELGLAISAAELQLLFVHHARLKAAPGIIENELQWVYLYITQRDIILHGEDDEVSSLKWISLEQLTAMRRGQQLVPHASVYFESLLAEIHYLIAA